MSPPFLSSLYRKKSGTFHNLYPDSEINHKPRRYFKSQQYEPQIQAK